MKYYLIAGEASGDMHGANLIKAIHQLDPNAEFRGWGGDRMEAVGLHLEKHYRDTAYMGFIEVVKNLRTILKNIEACQNDIEDNQPDALILIDYPGFNMRIAKWVKEKMPDLRVYYYISPQVWAWKSNRVHTLKKVVDKMFVILPFEKDFYRKYNFEVDYVGHPLIDDLDGESEINSPEKIIALLPGSRAQEIERHLEIMASVFSEYPEHRFIVAGVSTVDKSLYDRVLEKYPRLELVIDNSRSVLRKAAAALVASGTATLETALMDVPQVVCYKGSFISYHIAKRLVKIKYISLVNLVVDRPLIIELIQNDLNSDNLKRELDKLLFDENYREEIFDGYKSMRKLLGGPGASKRLAHLILRDLEATSSFQESSSPG